MVAIIVFFLCGPVWFPSGHWTPVRRHLQRRQMSALWTCPTRPAAKLLMTNKSLDGAVVVAIIRPLFSPSLLIDPLCWPVWIESSHVTRSMTWSLSAISAKRFSKCCTLQHRHTRPSVRPSTALFLYFSLHCYWCSCIWTGKVRWDYTHIYSASVLDGFPPSPLFCYIRRHQSTQQQQRENGAERPPARPVRSSFFFAQQSLRKNNHLPNKTKILGFCWPI